MSRDPEGALEMTVSLDCSEVVALVEQRCASENRQPTEEEYKLLIHYYQQANSQLIQMNEALNIQCAHLSNDGVITLNILHKEHLEVV